MAENVTNAAENNVVTAEQMAKAREVDFVQRFTEGVLKKLMEALGVARKIPMMEGTSMYVYKTTGTLQPGNVDEGEIIPLSQYERTRTAVEDITLNKWRKAVTAEAIKKAGYDEAMRQTDAKMLSDIQKCIRTSFFTFLKGLEGTAVSGDTLQAVLAKSWGRLQVLFEDDSVEPVHFINPLTIADYLATATVTTQTAFGMSYIQDFLGMGTVVMSSQIPENKVYSTAKENLVLYYLTMSGDVARAFDLTVDETGYIGMHTSQTDNRAQIETLVMFGIQFLVEYADGVVVGTIGEAAGGETGGEETGGETGGGETGGEETGGETGGGETGGEGD